MKPPINHLAIVAAVIAHQIVGFVWYGPLFGTAWMDLHGYTPESIQPSAAPFIIAIVASFAVTYCLAWLLRELGAVALASGVVIGAVCGLAFLVGPSLTTGAFESSPVALTLIDSLLWVVDLIISGAILGSWRRTAKS